jgi:subtilisin family serine protease
MAKKRAVLIGVALAAVACAAGVLAYLTDGFNPLLSTTATVNSSYEVKSDAIVSDDATGNYYVSDVVLVTFSPGTTTSEKNDLVRSLGGKVIGRLDDFDQYQLSVDASSLEDLRAVCEKYAQSDIVSFAQPDYANTVCDTTSYRSNPDDPWGQEGCPFAANTSGNTWWAAVTDMPSAWRYRDSGLLDPVPVGVVDSGFNMSHEDLDGVVSYASNDDTSNRNVRDHGTGTASIIGAAADNGKGITGVSWGSKVYCFDASPCTGDAENDRLPDSQILAGLRDTVESGAKVVNFSMGKSMWAASASDNELADQFCDDARSYSRAMQNLLNMGYDFVVVQSAGNGNGSGQGVDARYNLGFCAIEGGNCDASVTDPSALIDRIIVVGATREIQAGYIATEFSNGGDRVDVYAPGQDVYCATADGYDSLSGTSFSAPIVSGVAALVWSADPDMTGVDVKAAVSRQDSVPIMTNTFSATNADTGGLVDATNSVEATLKSAGRIDESTDALFAYQDFLDVERTNISTHRYPTSSGTVIANGGCYLFSIGDMDTDGMPELRVFYKTSDDSGKVYGNWTTEYRYNTKTNKVEEIASAGLPAPLSSASFYGNDAVEFAYEGEPSGTRAFFGGPENTMLQGYRASHGSSYAYYLFSESGGYSATVFGSNGTENTWSYSSDVYAKVIGSVTSGRKLDAQLLPTDEEGVNAAVNADAIAQASHDLVANTGYNDLFSSTPDSTSGAVKIYGDITVDETNGTVDTPLYHIQLPSDWIGQFDIAVMERKPYYDITGEYGVAYELSLTRKSFEGDKYKHDPYGLYVGAYYLNDAPEGLYDIRLIGDSPSQSGWSCYAFAGEDAYEDDDSIYGVLSHEVAQQSGLDLDELVTCITTR